MTKVKDMAMDTVERKVEKEKKTSTFDMSWL